MDQGMGVGIWEQGAELVRVNTFINHGKLFSNQLEDMGGMDLERMLYRLTPGQRRHLVAQYKRMHPEKVGKPGMEWLEGFAA